MRIELPQHLHVVYDYVNDAGEIDQLRTNDSYPEQAATDGTDKFYGSISKFDLECLRDWLIKNPTIGKHR